MKTPGVDVIETAHNETRVTRPTDSHTTCRTVVSTPSSKASP